MTGRRSTVHSRRPSDTPRLHITELILLYGWSKYAAVIGSNGVTWYKINFTSDYTQTQSSQYSDHPGHY